MRCSSAMDPRHRTVKQRSLRRSETSWETTVPLQTPRTLCKVKLDDSIQQTLTVRVLWRHQKSIKPINCQFLLSKELLEVIRSELRKSLKTHLNISLNAKSLFVQIAYHKSKTVVIRVYGSG